MEWNEREREEGERGGGDEILFRWPDRSWARSMGIFLVGVLRWASLSACVADRQIEAVRLLVRQVRGRTVDADRDGRAVQRRHRDMQLICCPDLAGSSLGEFLSIDNAIAGDLGVEFCPLSSASGYTDDVDTITRHINDNCRITLHY